MEGPVIINSQDCVKSDRGGDGCAQGRAGHNQKVGLCVVSDRGGDGWTGGDAASLLQPA